MGQRLRVLRESLGLTQRQVAERLSVGEGAYAAYEQGRARLITTDLPDLAAALRIDQARLVASLGLLSQEPPAGPPLVGRVRRTEDVELPVYTAHAGRLDLSRGSGSPETFEIRASRTFVVTVIGDCLYPSHALSAGDELLVDTERAPLVGELVVAQIGDETFLAEWLGNGGWSRLRLSDGQLREARERELIVRGVVTMRLSRMTRRAGHGAPGWLSVADSEQARQQEPRGEW